MYNCTCSVSDRTKLAAAELVNDKQILYIYLYMQFIPAFLKLWYAYHWWYNCTYQMVQLMAGRKLNFVTSQGKKLNDCQEEEFRSKDSISEVVAVTACTYCSSVVTVVIVVRMKRVHEIAIARVMKQCFRKLKMVHRCSDKKG